MRIKQSGQKYAKVKSSKIHGKGLFAIKTIKKGTRVIEYVGEKITSEEADRREIENDKKGITYIFYLNKKFCLDGANGGNESVYVNHSCEPNLNVVYKNGHIFYVANKTIYPKEELYIDYAFDTNEPKVICLCSSGKCRGTINV